MQTEMMGPSKMEVGDGWKKEVGEMLAVVYGGRRYGELWRRGDGREGWFLWWCRADGLQGVALVRWQMVGE